MKFQQLEELILAASFKGHTAEEIAQNWNLPQESIRRIRDTAYQRYRRERGIDEVELLDQDQ